MAACSKEIKGKHVVKCKKSTGACKQQKVHSIVDAAMSKSYCISDINSLESNLNIYLNQHRKMHHGAAYTFCQKVLSRSKLVRYKNTNFCSISRKGHRCHQILCLDQNRILIVFENCTVGFLAYADHVHDCTNGPQICLD